MNEEIFAISEELTKSISKISETTMGGLEPRVQDEFTYRKRRLVKKIRENVEENPVVKLLKRSARINGQGSPGSQKH